MQVLLECIFLGSMYNSFVRQDAQIDIDRYIYIHALFLKIEWKKLTGI